VSVEAHFAFNETAKVLGATQNVTELGAALAALGTETRASPVTAATKIAANLKVLFIALLFCASQPEN
jgi:hypothetical protein